ncbi:hypothetical protein CPY51_17685 [Rhizobium tubonense]|uniref:Uncharacterized protein n=2 Tax=Rhizobium tubonense TaxID=484088 RepID=A0A2W4D362_9HYPH|nr:hypothetical protein CPY51_17685 [Rhizobium tubonense]
MRLEQPLNSQRSNPKRRQLEDLLEEVTDNALNKVKKQSAVNTNTLAAEIAGVQVAVKRLRIFGILIFLLLLYIAYRL